MMRYTKKLILFDLIQTRRKNKGHCPPSPECNLPLPILSRSLEGISLLRDPPLWSSGTGQRAGTVCGPASPIKGFIFHPNAQFESRFQLWRMHPKHPTAICKSSIFPPKNIALNAIKLIQSFDVNNSEAQWLSKIEVLAYISMRYPSWKKFSH